MITQDVVLSTTPATDPLYHHVPLRNDRTCVRVVLTTNGTRRLVRPVTASVPTGTQDGGRSAPAVPAPERAFGWAVPVSAADPGQRRWQRRRRVRDRPFPRLVAADGDGPTAQTFQFVRLVRARYRGVAQLVLGQTLAAAALERIRRTSCDAISKTNTHLKIASNTRFKYIDFFTKKKKMFGFTPSTP